MATTFGLLLKQRIVVIALANILLILLFLGPSQLIAGDIDEKGMLNKGYIEYILLYAILTAICGLVTLFGLLSDPSAKKEDGSISESHVRLSIVVTLLVVFISHLRW
jgi:hypothetical protein